MNINKKVNVTETRLKIAMVTRVVAPFHGHGGMQRYIAELAAHLQALGHEIEIVASLPEPGEQIRTETVRGIRYTLLPPLFSGNWIDFWKQYRAFSTEAAQYLQSRDHDIVHGFGYAPYNYIKSKERRPTVIQTFGNESFKTRGLEKLANYAMWYPQSRYAMAHAEAIASEGEVQSKEIKHIFKIGGRTIFELPDGVDLHKIDGYLQNSTVSRRKIGFADDDFLIINVNRLEENKGVEHLIEAMPIVVKEVPNARLIIVGSGSREEAILGRVDELGLRKSFRHFKDIDDSLLFNLYGLSDIAVTPTIFEGLPIVMLEGMACSKPIVATDISDNAKVVKNDINGFLVPPGNVSKLASAIVELYRRPNREQMGLESRRMVTAYDWPIIARRASEKYQELVGTRQGAKAST